jgi:hypothetical protein
MDDRAVDRFVRSALAADRPEAGPHPEPDALFAYHVGELTDDETDEVQAHLALCPRCARVVADYVAFPALDPPNDEDVPSEDDVAEGWAAVRARLVVDGEGAAERVTPAPDAPARGVVVPFTVPAVSAATSRGSLQGLRAVAAALAVTALGTSFYAYQARQQLDKAKGVHANPFPVTLAGSIGADAGRRLRGGNSPDDFSPSVQTFRVPADAQSLLISVPWVTSMSEHVSFRAELWRDSQLVWGGVLERNAADHPLMMIATPTSVQPGVYRLVVTPNDDAGGAHTYIFGISQDP